MLQLLYKICNMSCIYPTPKNMVHFCSYIYNCNYTKMPIHFQHKNNECIQYIFPVCLLKPYPVTKTFSEGNG